MPVRPKTVKTLRSQKLLFNADVVAIAIALSLAALIRLNVIPHVSW